MTEPKDPPRLLEISEEGSLLRLGLDASRDDLPSEQQLASLWDRLPGPSPDPDGSGGDGDAGPDATGGGDLGGAEAAAATATAAASGSVGTGKVIGVLAIAAALTTGVTVHLTTTDPAPAPPPAISAVVSISPAETAAPPTVPATISTSAPTASTVAAATSTASVAVRPSATAAAAAEVDAGEPPPSEIALLRQAQAALGGDPARALALVSQGDQLYPRGLHGTERQLIRIQALAGLGRRAEAVKLARIFVTATPDSAYARRLRVLFPELRPK